MSVSEIVGSVLTLFSDVTAAVEKYREAKTDRDSRSLARRLANEAALYNHFVRKLLLLAHSSSVLDAGIGQRIQAKLGIETANLLGKNLQSMQTLLRAFNADLANTSRGTVCYGHGTPKKPPPPLY